jgi:Flp pilus assembly protein TadG
MRRLRTLWRDTRGTSAIEMAIVIPVLVSMIWGMFQIGLVFQANAGVHHALGEAARHATLYPTPANSAITAQVSGRAFGTYNGTLSSLTITNHDGTGAEVTDAQVAAGTKTVSYKQLTLVYNQPLHFLFMNGPTVTITRTKRVFLGQ